MPTVILRAHLLQEPFQKDKTRYKVRVYLEISGTPVAGVNEMVNLLQELEFKSEDGSHEEKLEFNFNDGRFHWVSNVETIQIRHSKETIEDWEVSEKPIHELFSYTILPHIIDVAVGRRWRMISNSEEMMVFFRPETRGPQEEYITPMSRSQFTIEEEEKKNKKKKDRESLTVTINKTITIDNEIIEMESIDEETKQKQKKNITKIKYGRKR